MKSTYFIPLLVMLAMACATQPSKPALLSRLNGSWVREFNHVKQVVVWTNSKTKANTHSYFVNQSDSVLMELSEISQDHQWNLLLSYPDNDLTQMFQLSENESHKLVFTNDSKEWPQTIVYELQTDSTLRISTKGTRMGQPKEVAFTFQRITP